MRSVPLRWIEMYRTISRNYCDTSGERAIGVRRAHVSPQELAQAKIGSHVGLGSTTSNHFTKVLRLKENTVVELFDGGGISVFGKLKGVSVPKHSFVTVTSKRKVDNPLPPLIIAQAWTKTSKIEEVVQRSTEMGASDILFWNAKHSSSKHDLKSERLTKIAADASRQSGRVFLPKIHPLLFPSIVECLQYSELWTVLKVAGSLKAEKSLYCEIKDTTKTEIPFPGLLVFIGPEGGLDDTEEVLLTKNQVALVKLGEYAMRTETAGLAALAVAQVALGKM